MKLIKIIFNEGEYEIFDILPSGAYIEVNKQIIVTQEGLKILKQNNVDITICESIEI